MVPWQAGLMFVGLTGLPHPDVLQGWALKLKSALNLDEDPFAQFNDPQFQQQANADAQQAAQILMIILVSIVALIIFSFVAMCMYKSNVHDHKPPIPDPCDKLASGNFHYGLFDCFTNTNECLCSCFCSSIRFADTYSAIGMGGFWSCFFQFIGLNIIVGVISERVGVAAFPPPPEAAYDFQALARWQSTENEIVNIVGILLRGLIFGLWARGKLRTRLGDPGTGGGAVKAQDLLAWGCCPCCALTQESVEVDIAADVSISCPWTLNKGRVRAREVVPDDYESLCGDAVLLEGR